MSTSGDQSPSGSRRNQGRRKINIAKIENESNLQVTFSIRRAGLFKKASELCTLTGAEAGMVVFSPGDKAHSFGHPNVSSVVDRYLNSQEANASNAPNEDQEEMASTRQRELDYLAEVERMIAMERARGEELSKMKKNLEKEKLMPPGIDALNYEQLNMLKGSVVEFQKNLELQVRQRMAYPMAPFPIEPFVASQSFPGFSGPSGVGIDPYGEGQSTVVPYDQGASSGGGHAGDVNGGEANMNH